MLIVLALGLPGKRVFRDFVASEDDVATAGGVAALEAPLSSGAPGVSGPASLLTFDDTASVSEVVDVSAIKPSR